jgi:caffeoyl-CoA O-methyltransferase
MAEGKFTALTDELHAYLVEHGARQDDVLRRLEAETVERFPDWAVMQIAADQGAFIELLVRAIGARRALEVGTFTGYSAICIARALPEGGELVACELREEYAQIARAWFAEAGVADRIDLRVGPALDTLRSLPPEEGFEFAFIDADKSGYPDYYEESLARLRPGGLMMLDNMLLGGRVLEPAGDDESAQAIVPLNERIARDERVDISMLGIADGVTLARKR